MKKQLEHYNILFLLLIGVFTFSQCTLLDNEQPIPAYLKIDSINITTAAGQGEATHDLTDVWVSANGVLLGTFELPANIPIIVDENPTSIIISPGFRNNGETSRSFTYNLMKPITLNENLEPGQILEPELVFRYNENVIFDFVEDFESSGHIFTLELDDDETTKIVRSSEEQANGSFSGKIALTTEHPEIITGTILRYDGDLNAGSDSYLEMEYKNDVPFGVGVIYVQEGEEVTQPLIVLNPKDEWNKIYIDYTSILTSPLIESYRVYFSTDLGPLNATEGNIFIDNVKFVHL